MVYTMKADQFPPKTTKQVKKERVEVVTKLFDGNLLRFLRRNYKHQRYQLTYSVVLKAWEKQGYTQLVEGLKQSYKYPAHLNEIVAVMRTLVKYYDKPLDSKTRKIAEAVVDLFEEDIYWHTRKRLGRYIGSTGKINLVDSKKALKEQKARGFVHINEFEDYKRKYSHIYSLVDPDYIYPVNFVHGWTPEHKPLIDIYIGITLVGVEGFTRTVIPKIR